MFDAMIWIVMAYGVEVWGWGKKEQVERAQKKYLKCVLGVNWRTPGYIIREELQLEKLRTRAGKRACGFERLAEGRGSKLAGCWEEMRGRIKRGVKLSEWKRERKEFFEERGRGIIKMEEKKKTGSLISGK